MFNKDIPYNDLPLLPGNFDYNQTKFLKLAIRVSWKLEKINWLIYLLPNKNLLISPLLTKESVESSAIENINTTTIKVLQTQALGIEKAKWPEKEVLHYKEAILYGYEKVKQYWGIPLNLIIEIQKIIEPNKPWIRKLPWTVISNWVEVIYTPPEGQDNIMRLLSNLENFINNFDDDIEPLVKLPVIHYQFEAVHPFYDWNGRTWRILNILYLVLSKKLDFPILFLSEYINKTKSTYYKLLNKTTETWDYSKFIVYILEWIITQSEKTNQTILRIFNLMKETEEKLSKFNLDYHKITEILFSNPFLDIKTFSKKLWVSEKTVSRYIKKFEENKIISSKKVWKHKLIYIPEFIRLLS